MKAGETSLQKLMNSSLQFMIPIYQRTYSWTQKQCLQLWTDIIKIANDTTDKVHFIGSVVYIDFGTPLGRPQQLLLIDGQQRITTLSLLLCALVRNMEEQGIVSNLVTTGKIHNQFLLNSDEAGMDKYKLLLTEQDKDTLTRLLDGTEKTLINPSKRILDNFQYFMKMLSDEDVDKVFLGINKLALVAISLDKTADNPQLIFESMNSTGKDLSQADLIRNYILMGLSQDEQNRLYQTYWRPMEQSFGQQGYTDYFDWFMRDFLTSQNSSGRICKIGEVYEAFKIYHNNGINNEQILKSVYTYSKYYTSIHLGTEQDKELEKLWKQVRILDVGVSYPFLMRVYNDYENGIVLKEEFITIIEITISYIVRRVLCEIPTNSLNKTFATLFAKINKEQYLTSVLAEYVLKDSYRSFPTDAEIEEKLLSKDVYHLRIKNYILESLENANHKEPISVTGNGLTVEHIMPQNQNLNATWKVMLGDNWKEIHRTYLHTIGNLTLTGYNSEMSDRPFNEKRDHEKGFVHSHLQLNSDIAILDKWDEDEIIKRTHVLAKRIIKLWKYPEISEEDLQAYKGDISSEHIYVSMEHYPDMFEEVKSIFEELDRKILSLDTGIRKEFRQQYIAYKLESNFVNIKPSKSELTVGLNIPFDEISDDKGICRDTTNIGNFANNPVLFKVRELYEVEYAIKLINQSLLYQLN